MNVYLALGVGKVETPDIAKTTANGGMQLTAIDCSVRFRCYVTTKMKEYLVWKCLARAAVGLIT